MDTDLIALRDEIDARLAEVEHTRGTCAGHPALARAIATLLRCQRAQLNQRAPDLEVEGEMHGDAALDERIRQAAFPNSKLKGQANLLIMPTLDAANISFNLLKVAAGDNLTIGPILLGAAKPVNILTPTATVRRIVNMTALTVVDAV